ncbi:sugar ABC transporter permease [Rhizobium sp. KVB221]|uniref:Sugar ABC transporter permease n=1 Tax=Rhizobium setariae TaxID=2801340 RepID=A0A936YWY4_9HYPH|nr:sugar ABC transporter permease [Rhizobium setariae]MBL0375225.1 sugar ABC transporter permease [Rhizobium setariae]
MSGSSTPSNSGAGKLAEAIGARKSAQIGLFTTLPAQLLLLFIVVFPTIVTVYISLTWWTPLDGIPWTEAYTSFAWFDNYVEIFNDNKLMAALGRTLFIVIIACALEFVFGFGLALLFVDKFRMRPVYYTLILMPMMVVPAVAGYMFLMLFQSTGPINQIISAVIGQPFEVVWLADEKLALVAVIVGEVWQWTPMVFLILLAGLMSVPEDQIKAARLLGANGGQVLWRISIPRIKTVMAIAIGIRFIEGLKLFDIMYIMTKGGPGVATETLSLYIYKRTYGDLEWAYVSALGLAIVLSMSLIALGLMASLKAAGRRRMAGVTAGNA